MNDSGTNYRLHHIPFLLMWIGLFGVAWLSAFVGGTLLAYVRSSVPFLQEIAGWIYVNARWIDGVILGTFIGGMLATVQPWLIRWRYGFAPRFWRLATFIGAIIGSVFFSEFIYMNGYYDSAGVWTYPDYTLSMGFWFITLAFVQMLALWPVARRAWPYLFAGIGALAAGLSIDFLDRMANSYDYYYRNPFNLLFYGTVTQAVLSGLLFLWLMRDYRVEAVPKRDEKAKMRMGMGLHPISFIGLWAMAYLFGLTALAGTAFLVYTVGNLIHALREPISWILRNQYVTASLIGLLVGTVSAMPQPWLMQQRSGYSPRFWLWVLLSGISWAIAGQALPDMTTSSYYVAEKGMVWYFAMLLVWFALPTVIQSLVFIRAKRGFWLYALAGIVSAVMAYFVNQQLAWTGTSLTYALVLGAGMQAILTGAAFLVMMAQNQQVQETPVEAAPATE